MRMVIVFAGPNGSGKSTTIAEQMKSPNFPDLYICPDIMVKEFSHIEDIKERYIKAMEACEKIRVEAVKQGKSFAFETVFSTSEKLDFLKHVKEQGYTVQVAYVTTKDPNINIERVNQRANTGGHDVPPDKIISRYERSMSLLPDIINVANTVQVIDNSNNKPFIALIKENDGNIFLLNKELRNDWIDKYVINPLLNSGYLKAYPKDLNIRETNKYLQNLDSTHSEEKQKIDIKETIVKNYSKEFPNIKYISEETAKLINYINEKLEKDITVKQIHTAYKEYGKKIEAGNDEYKNQFNMFKEIVEDLKHCGLISKQAQAEEKIMKNEKQIDKNNSIEL